MKFHHLVKQTAKYHQNKQIKKGKSGKLAWYQLSLIGIGSIIGAGFFLGTGLSIHTAGPAILFSYLIGGITAYLVFGALAEMTVNDEESGSFRKYAKVAFGHYLGFMSGWMYWVAGVLIISSEITALSIFTQFWFPKIPLWIFAVSYSILGIAINLLGVKDFGRIESLFAIIKTSVLVIFIVFGGLFLFRVITPHVSVSGSFSSNQHIVWAPNGFMGIWSTMIFVFFSYGGIAVLSVLSNELKNKKDITKVGTSMIIALSSIYILSLFFVLYIVSWNKISDSESPFVTTLSNFDIPYIDSLFNIIIISAAFSTMIGAFFSITRVLVSLANDGDAPKILGRHNKKGVAVYALLLNGLALALFIFLSFALPDKVYEYLTTAAGVMLILNWLIIFASQLKNHHKYVTHQHTFKLFGYPYSSYIGIGLILFTVTGALTSSNERIGVFVSFGIIILISISYKILFRKKV